MLVVTSPRIVMRMLSVSRMRIPAVLSAFANLVTPEMGLFVRKTSWDATSSTTVGNMQTASSIMKTWHLDVNATWTW